MIVGLMISGVVMAAIPFSYNYSIFVTAGVLYGFLQAPVHALLSVVLGEITTLDKLNYAFGIVAFVQGIGNFCGPLAAGFLVDTFRHTSDEYGLMLSYIFGGCCQAIAGISCCVTAYAHRRRQYQA